jgi:hypothetical protein
MAIDIDFPVFTDEGGHHEKGNLRCDACWSTREIERCHCGGLIHNEFFDEIWAGDDYGTFIELNFRCDKCRKTGR